MPPQKVIIDCDPGIDDAMSLFMAMAAHDRGQLKILAITLVAGNTSLANCSTNAMRVLEIARKTEEIPVYRGASRGLVHKYVDDQPPYHGANGFNDVEFKGQPDLSKVKDGAASAIMSLVNQNLNQVKIIALGPLTNIATCFIMDEGFSSKLAGLSLMGGNSKGIGNVTTCAEFNFHADPEAAFVVLDRCNMKHQPLKVLPWETCHYGNYVDWAWARRTLGSLKTAQMELLNKLFERWSAEKAFDDQFVMCDQVAMAVFIKPEVAATSEIFHGCTVELQGASTRGMMVIEKRHRHDVTKMTSIKVEIVEKINSDMFKDLLVDLLSVTFK